MYFLIGAILGVQKVSSLGRGAFFLEKYLNGFCAICYIRMEFESLVWKTINGLHKTAMDNINFLDVEWIKRILLCFYLVLILCVLGLIILILSIKWYMLFIIIGVLVFIEYWNLRGR
ncbi:hypothetical protein CEE44_05290 [Candidatus Woesearchaeota archaeon B3_Woes]|nr:MAG: hypothetical protein CEE44_05290 [Candidatus Woesearchaeota archaeon B3_Woes]